MLGTAVRGSGGIEILSSGKVCLLLSCGARNQVEAAGSFQQLGQRLSSREPALVWSTLDSFVSCIFHFRSRERTVSLSGYVQWGKQKILCNSQDCLFRVFSCSTDLVPQVSTRKHVSLERVILTFKTCLSLLNAFTSTLASSKLIRNLCNVLISKYTTPKSILWQWGGLRKKGNVKRWEEQESGAYSWLHHHAEHGSQ